MTLGPPGRLVVWAVAFGAAASLVLRLPTAPLLLAAAAVAAPTAFRGQVVLAVVIASLGLGLAVGGARLDRLDRDPLAPRIGETIEANVVVTGSWRSSPGGWKAEARLDEGTPVLLRIVGVPPARGSILAVTGRLSRPRGPSGGFDERTLLAHAGIHAVLRADRQRVVGHRGGVLGVLDAVRSGTLDTYRAAGTDDGGRLLGAIALGADERLTDETRVAFRDSGLAHLLAVSGANVALLAGLVGAVVWTLGGGRTLAQALAILAIAGYVGVVGPSPSVTRAGVAGILTVAAWLLSRPADSWHLFGAALAVLLAWNPYDLYHPGLQLSFAAVAAILLVVPRLREWLAGTPCPPLLAAPLAVSAAGTLATAPIAWWHFGQINLVAALPANVLAAPAAVLLLWLGALSAAIGPFVPAAGDGLAALARGPGLYLLAVARWGAALEDTAGGAVQWLLPTAATGLLAGVLWRRSAAPGRRPPTARAPRA